MALSPTLLFASNSAWNLSHFRGALIRNCIEGGADVVCAVPFGEDALALEAMGARVVRVRLSRSGLSPLADLRLYAEYARLLRKERPQAFLGFTAKPNIYGSLAARRAGVAAINNISGLGTGFLSGGLLRGIMTTLYLLALKRSSTVFFQNEDDLALFVGEGLVERSQTRLIRGSGVDLDRFTPRPGSKDRRSVRFLLVSRMLRDKGVVEFVEAARALKAGGVEATFALLGPAGDDNRSAIDRSTLDAWNAEGAVEWLGPSDDVRDAMGAADVVVLPSYREGMPRTLIEAAAMGRPVIATDAPGCRQAVRDGVTGLLCAPRDARSLAGAMREMVDVGPSGRAAMGMANRRRAEQEFGIGAIVAAYRTALADCGVELAG